jgi:putative PIN family toxin of toxin-antitoxin system
VRVLLDSSVIVAAYISRAGACAGLLEDILTDHEWIPSNFILDELSCKLKGKFGYSDQEVTEVRETIIAAAEIVTPEEIPADACRDPNDLPILGTAMAGHAEIIITVGKDLLALRTYREIPIVKPGEFWRLLDSSALKEETAQVIARDAPGEAAKSGPCR